MATNPGVERVVAGLEVIIGRSIDRSEPLAELADEAFEAMGPGSAAQLLEPETAHVVAEVFALDRQRCRSRLERWDVLSDLQQEILVDTIGLSLDPEGLPFLAQATLETRSNWTALWAAGSLAKFGDQATPIVEALLSKTLVEPRRLYLIDALEKIGSPRALAIAETNGESGATEDSL